jgi:hypothetical protein
MVIYSYVAHVMGDGTCKYVQYLATDHIFPEWNVFANFNRTVCPDGYGMACKSLVTTA